ncbi:MAG: YHYH protein, partial [Verrucomicrobiae bacterium]|nr:YHYH protein [Verrucomicrobiae bacterium]
RQMEAIELPSSQVQISIAGDKRVIDSNGIPNHDPGDFPNRGNPNALRPLNYHFTVPANPKVADKPTAVERQPFGVAINGVPFDPGTAEYWRGDMDSGWRYDALSGNINLGIDNSNGHVQPTGAYHYHGVPNGLEASLDHSKGMILIGYAADGFPVYSRYGYKDPMDPMSEVIKVKPGYQLKDGQRPDGPRGYYDGTFVQDWKFQDGTGELDEHNGRFGVTPEYPDGIYHYYLTDTYPFIPRSFKGSPDASFERRNQHGFVRGLGPR